MDADNLRAEVDRARAALDRLIDTVAALDAAPAVTEPDLRAAFIRGLTAREEAERAWASYKGDPRAALDFIADWAHDCIDVEEDTKYGFDAIERLARNALATPPAEPPSDG